MPKTCYYVVLGVDSTCDGDELKKAYRKCALRWHPDKNIGNEAAHSKFLAVKEAYTILSDPHERAWYDKHKDQILNEGTQEFDCFNVFPYFTSSCFSGYNDDEKGFYAVYRMVFENINAEDESVVGRGKCLAPSFGEASSSYEDVVEPFYAHWNQYCTKITYAWKDERVSKEYGRKAIKLITKENMKKRNKLRKERNDEIRNLVSFVFKRDKRVKAWRKKMEEEKRERLQKTEENRREQWLEKKRMNETYEECDWAKFSGLENELEKVEKSLDECFSQDESDSDGDSENSAVESLKPKTLYCLACRKLFQSEKAFENHEGSKKHKQNAAALAAASTD